MFMGIDLTSSQKKATACAVLDPSASLTYLGFKLADDDILALAQETGASSIGIDAPLGFPRGMHCLEEDHDCASVHSFSGRLCERALVRRGIGLYITTKKSFIKPMIYRAIRLAESLRAQGRTVLEVYPFASKVILFGRPIPKKTTPEGIAFMRERLNPLVGGLDTWERASESWERELDHDLCDALAAAYTTYLHAQGRTETLGDPDEAQIIVPRADGGLERPRGG